MLMSEVGSPEGSRPEKVLKIRGRPLGGLGRLQAPARCLGVSGREKCWDRVEGVPGFFRQASVGGLWEAPEAPGRPSISAAHHRRWAAYAMSFRTCGSGSHPLSDTLYIVLGIL